MLDYIKSIIPVNIKRTVKLLLSREHIDLTSQSARMFIFLAADYGNIGDLAITAAQENFLARHSKGRPIIKIPISRTDAVMRSIREQVRPHDLITIIGGGNMGSLYPDIEELRQRVIRSFPGNRIVCFPQSIDWKKSQKSDDALARIVRTYSAHPDIHIFARESVSRDKLRDLFVGQSSVRVGYVPDIVLSTTSAELGFADSPLPRGILLCMRNDGERSLQPNQLSRLRASLQATGLDITVTDTHAGGSRLSEDHCARLLAEKLRQFAGAQLVVTDRLHGMILSLIAGTPCLVLPNDNHKIRQTWRDWLSELPQLIFVEQAELPQLPRLVAKLLEASRRDPIKLSVDFSHYRSLADAVAER